MKNKRSLILITAMTFSFVSPAFAGSEKLTAEDVHHMVWENTLDKTDYADDVMKLEYADRDNLNAVIKMADVIDPSSTRVEAVQDFSDYHYTSWICKDKKDSEKYYSMLLYQDDEGEIKITNFLDLTDHILFWQESDERAQAIADIVNSQNIGKVYKIYQTDLSTGIEAENGNYLILNNEDTTKAEPQEGFTVIDDNTLFVDRGIYEKYLEENDQLRDQWFKEASEEMHKKAPKLPMENDDLAESELLPDTDSLAPYIGTQSKYSDVSEKDAPYVNLLSDLDIMQGYDDGTFVPDKEITRAEMSAILCRLFKVEPEHTGSFSDVDITHWASEYIGGFTQLGILNGYDDGTFKPEKSITYDELFKIAVLMTGYGTDYYFMPSSNSYPYGTNSWALNFGFADGLGSIETGSNITRLNAAKILCNLLDTHLYTMEHLIGCYNPGLISTGRKDITLGEWRLGKPLVNGMLLRTEAEYNEFCEQADKLKTETFGDILERLDKKLESRYFMNSWIR